MMRYVLLLALILVATPGCVTSGDLEQVAAALHELARDVKQVEATNDPAAMTRAADKMEATAKTVETVSNRALDRTIEVVKEVGRGLTAGESAGLSGLIAGAGMIFLNWFRDRKKQQAVVTPPPTSS